MINIQPMLRQAEAILMQTLSALNKILDAARAGEGGGLSEQYDLSVTLTVKKQCIKSSSDH